MKFVCGKFGWLFAPEIGNTPSGVFKTTVFVFGIVLTQSPCSVHVVCVANVIFFVLGTYCMVSAAPLLRFHICSFKNRVTEARDVVRSIL